MYIQNSDISAELKLFFLIADVLFQHVLPTAIITLCFEISRSVAFGMIVI